MKDSTLSLLTRFETNGLLRRVGQPVSVEGVAQCISSLHEALDCLAAEMDDAVSLASYADLANWISRNARDRSREWNTHISAIKPQIIQHVNRAVSARFGVWNFFSWRRMRKLKDALNWDLLACCMAAEYSDLREVRFYRILTELYLEGHMVCGWDGDVPKDFDSPWPADAGFIVY